MFAATARPIIKNSIYTTKIQTISRYRETTQLGRLAYLQVKGHTSHFENNIQYV